MHSERFTGLVYSILGLLTAGYCWLVWLAMGAFQALLSEDVAANLPRVSRWTMFPLFPVPLHALHWQVIAVAIFLGCGLWGSWRQREIGRAEGHALPAIVLIGWILQMACWHAVGFLAPMVSTCAVIE